MRRDGPVADRDHHPLVVLRVGVVTDRDLVLVLRSTRPAVRERGAAEHAERYEQQTRHDGRADEPAVCSSKQFLHPATSRVTDLGSGFLRATGVLFRITSSVNHTLRARCKCDRRDLLTVCEWGRGASAPGLTKSLDSQCPLMKSLRNLSSKLCWRDVNLTTSPIETMPTTIPSSTTGRCLILRSVITAMHSSIDVSGVTTTSGDDITSRTAIVSSSRRSSAIRRR